MRTESPGRDECEPMLRQLLPFAPGALRRDHREQSTFSRDIDVRWVPRLLSTERCNQHR
jgi:hypothetical protein